jgi:hypothetical protein
MVEKFEVFAPRGRLFKANNSSMDIICVNENCVTYIFNRLYVEIIVIVNVVDLSYM